MRRLFFGRRVLAVAALLVALSAAWPPGDAFAGSDGPSAAPARVVTDADVPYREGNAPGAALDVYAPVGARVLPLVVLVHGGGLFRGDKKDVASLGKSIAARGFVVFNANYALSDDGTPAYPRDVEQVLSALAWSRAHAREYGADPDRVALVGASAGAYLVAMAGLEANRQRRVVDAVVSLSGALDLASIPAIQDNCRQDCGWGVSPTLLLGCPISGCPDALVRRASPADQVTKRSPAFFLANATNEISPLPQVRVMQERLESAGVPVDVDIVPGTAHAEAYASVIAVPALAFLDRYVTQERAGGGTPWLWVAVGTGTAVLFAALLTVLVASRRRRGRRAKAMLAEPAGEALR